MTNGNLQNNGPGIELMAANSNLSLDCWGTSWNHSGIPGAVVGGGDGGGIPGCGNQSFPSSVVPHIGETHVYVTLIFYLTTFVFGLAGNSLVIYIIARYSEVRTKSVANYYILNLALADELFTLALPLFCYASWTKNWVFGNPLCKIMTVVREINKFAGIFTLVALSLDRYVASYHTLGAFRTLTVGKCICVSIWVASLLMCMPYLLYSYSIEGKGGRATCKLNWPQENYLIHLRLWTYSQITIGLIVPFLLICLSYFLLMHRLKAIMQPRLSQRIRKPNRKMTRTVLVVVIGFIVCQLPYYVVDLMNLHKQELVRQYIAKGLKYTPTPEEIVRHVYINAFAQILLFISGCINPILYGIFNDNFSKYLFMIFCVLLKIKTHINHLAGRTLTYDWSVNSFIMVVYRQFFETCFG